MNCTKIEKLLPLYVEGDLAGPQMNEVASHLSSCADCRALGEEFAASQERLRNFAAPEFGAEFYEQLRGAVMTEITYDSPLARPSIFQRLGTLFPQRPRLAASLASVAFVGLLCLALYLSLTKSDATLTALEQGRMEFNPNMMLETREEVPLADANVNSNGTGIRRSVTAGNTLRRSPSPAVREKVMPESSAPQSAEAANPTVAEAAKQTQEAASDGNSAQAVARMDIQTSDPNIRIIWLARKASE